VAGIPISLHLSFFLLVLLVMAAGSQPGGLGITSGLLWLLALFLCVLIHELAHSLLARTKGAVVRRILLLPIGGLSEFEHMPEGWRDELEIAAVGPVASLGLAVLAAAGALATGTHLLPATIYGGALLPRLAWANLLLGLFNLLPAFPLDGGRVLRAALERTRDAESATRFAATVGRALAAAMAFVGLFVNVWLLLLGAFIFFAATAEEHATKIHLRLRGLAAGQLMRWPVYPLDARQQLSSVPWADRPPMDVVTSDGAYVGVVRAESLAAARPDQRVGELTDREAPTLEADEDVGRSGLDRLISSGYPALAVVEGGQVIGVLVADDVAEWLDHRPGVSPARPADDRTLVDR
jgi:Zn-dependent protease